VGAALDASLSAPLAPLTQRNVLIESRAAARLRLFTTRGLFRSVIDAWRSAY
jgi:hypothetical protein